jgi:hypothetical protein
VSTDEPKAPAPKKRIVSKEFRTVVVSTISGGASENLVQLTFGLEVPDPDANEDFIMEEVRLVMTPRTLKMTQRVLTNLLETLEGVLGEIPAGPIPSTRVEKTSRNERGRQLRRPYLLSSFAMVASRSSWVASPFQLREMVISTLARRGEISATCTRR